MMTRTTTALLLFLFTLCATAQVSIEQKIDSIQILIGQQTDLTLTVTAKQGARVAMPSFLKGDPAVTGQVALLTPGIEVLDEQTDTTTANGRMTITKRYTLTSFDDTLHYLPPMTIKVDGKKYESQGLALKVLTVPVDTLHPEQFFPPKDVQNNPFLWSEWYGEMWLMGCILVAVLLLIYLFLRLKHNKPIIVRMRIVKKILPHQKALQEIELIKSEKLSMQADQKAYYTMLTDVLRRYIEERFGFNAMEMTTTEIIAHLREDGDQKMIRELRELLVTADLVKFAKHSALINENDANLVAAIDFINTTKQDNLPAEEKVAPTLTDQDRRTIQARKVLKVAIIVLAVAAVTLLACAIYQTITLI